MEQDGVVLLHGIFLPSCHLWRLAHFLRRNGYEVLNIHYPSTHIPIEEIVDYIHPVIEKFRAQVLGKLYWVGYSMGGLVIRAYIHKYVPEVDGRVVMLGTPNHGSEAADYFKNWWLYQKLYGPAGQQLVTAFGDAERLFGKVRYELGIIAGSLSLDPVASYIIRKPNDGKVSVESTYLEGMKEHVTVPVDHTFLPLSGAVLEHTLHFLREGTFKR